jgi:transcription elongation factor SPT6
LRLNFTFCTELTVTQEGAGWVVDEDEEDEEGSRGRERRRKKKRKHRERERSDDALDEEDLDLIGADYTPKEASQVGVASDP